LKRGSFQRSAVSGQLLQQCGQACVSVSGAWRQFLVFGGLEQLQISGQQQMISTSLADPMAMEQNGRTRRHRSAATSAKLAATDALARRS